MYVAVGHYLIIIGGGGVVLLLSQAIPRTSTTHATVKKVHHVFIMRVVIRKALYTTPHPKTVFEGKIYMLPEEPYYAYCKYTLNNLPTQQ